MKLREPDLCRTGIGFVVQGWILVSLALAGCGATRTPPPAQNSDGGQAAEMDSTAASDATDQGSASARTDELPAEQDDLTQEANPPSTPGATEPPALEPVGPEDARRGKTIAGGGIITEPLRQNFLIRHRIAFLNLQNTEKLYRAEKGRMPESHEEYMTEIIEKGGIQLPELDPGWEYFYDATDGELKKRRTS